MPHGSSNGERGLSFPPGRCHTCLRPFSVNAVGRETMIRNVDMQAGIELGLRFACLLNGRGGCSEVDWQGIASWRPEHGFLWIHLERDVPEAVRWINEESGLEPLVAQALLDDESRPTIESFDGALLLVLRGVNLAEKDEIELVPIHIWIDRRTARHHPAR